MNQDKVTEKLRAGLFKPNCALGMKCFFIIPLPLSSQRLNRGTVLIDLFMRLGYITPDNEENYMKLATRTHGRFSYELW